MKTIKKVLIIILFLSGISFAQIQEKIPWPSLADSPWPVARGDVQGTGRSEYVGPKTPNIIWKKSYPLGIYNGPVIGLDGNLIFGTKRFSSEGNYFYCTDTQGNQIWRYETNNAASNDGAPAVAADGTIYFGSQSDAFFALDKDGELIWKYHSSSAFHVRNTVLDKNGNVYTANADTLFSFTPGGEIRFKLNIGSIIGFGLVFSPSGEYLYAATSNNNIYAIDTAGIIQWETILNQMTLSTPLVDNNGNIYIIEWTDYLVCLDSTGNAQWKYNIESGGMSGGITMDKNGNIFSIARQRVNGTQQYGIISLDYFGNFRWFYGFGIQHPYSYHELILHGLVCDAEGTVYAGSTFGNYLYAISSEGELLWKIPLDGMYADSSPVIGRDGTMYVGLHKGSANNLENTLIAIKDNPNSVKDEELPSEYKLEQNYPNPFNPSTTIKFSLPERSEVKLSIYNLLGQEIEVLFQGEKEAGSYEYVFENKSLSTGVYFYVLESKQVRLSRKMLLIK